jgi:hypothetical protein
MVKNELSAAWSADGLIIKTADSAEEINRDKPWKVARLDSKRLLAFSEGAESNPAGAAGFAYCSADMLYDLIIGMNHRRWSGMISVDTGSGHKRIYFNAGEFVFAASDLIDDRLGEVIYRESTISLDQLTSFAVQVDRKTKFGQVLLRSGSFTNTDLWNSLKSQVREIFRSIFLVDRCYIELQTGAPPIEVTFENGTEELLDAAYSFGTQFRAFSKRVGPDVRVIPIENPIGPSCELGTFAGDIMELTKDAPSLQDVLSRSKLAPINTLVAIHRLVATGYLRLDGITEPVVSKMDGSFGNLKSRIDGYQVLHGLVSPAFQSAGVAMPLVELTSFALSLNHDGGATVFLDQNGALPAESVSSMLQQCASNTHRLAFYQIRIETLTRYLLQIAGDVLPFEIARKIKNEFKEITS